MDPGPGTWAQCPQLPGYYLQIIIRCYNLPKVGNSRCFSCCAIAIRAFQKGPSRYLRPKYKTSRYHTIRNFIDDLYYFQPPPQLSKYDRLECGGLSSSLLPCKSLYLRIARIRAVRYSAISKGFALMRFNFGYSLLSARKRQCPPL